MFVKLVTKLGKEVSFNSMTITRIEDNSDESTCTLRLSSGDVTIVKHTADEVKGLINSAVRTMILGDSLVSTIDNTSPLADLTKVLASPQGISQSVNSASNAEIISADYSEYELVTGFNYTKAAMDCFIYLLNLRRSYYEYHKDTIKKQFSIKRMTVKTAVDVHPETAIFYTKMESLKDLFTNSTTQDTKDSLIKFFNRTIFTTLDNISFLKDYDKKFLDHCGNVIKDIVNVPELFKINPNLVEEVYFE